MTELTKIWDKLGVTPWEFKIASLRERGMPEHDAWNAVVMEWMQAGNFRPLLAMIKDNPIVGLRGGPVLNLLAQMLASGRLVVPRGNGHPVDLEAGVRDQFAADIYEDGRESFRVDDTGEPIPSEALFEIVGSMAGKSPDSVRKAVKAKRKAKS
jgi:hypothetical protein